MNLISLVVRSGYHNYVRASQVTRKFFNLLVQDVLVF